MSINIPNKGTGVVENVSWRGVKIRTFQNKMVVISNAVLGKEAIEVAPRDNLNARLVFFNTLYSAFARANDSPDSRSRPAGRKRFAENSPDCPHPKSGRQRH